MHFLQRLSALALAAVLVASCGAGGDEDPSHAAGGRRALRIGLEPKYPPFEETDASGACVGFDVDLVRALSVSLGREPVFVPMDFDALIPELQSGRIDVVCSGMSRTDERAKSVDFTRPYLRTTMGVLVSREKAADVQAIRDLDAAGMVIAVQRGTTGETKAAAAFPKATVRPYDTEVDAASEVEAGRAHAFVYDMASVRKLAAKTPERVRILPGDLGAEEYCIALPKGSSLVRPMDAFLEAASAEGDLVDRLVERWKPTAEPVRPGAPAQRAR